MQVRDSLDNEIARADEMVAAAESEISRFDIAFQEAEREFQVAAQVLDGAKTDLERAQDEKKEIKSRIDEEMNEHHDTRVCSPFCPLFDVYLNILQAQQRSIREHVKAAESRIEDTERDIAQETQRLADINGRSYARLQEELEEQKAEAVRARQQYEEHLEDAHRLRDDIRRAQEEVKQNTVPLSKQKSDIEQAETLLENLTKDRGAQHAGFHEKMPALLRAIRQETSFSRAPVGPIGHHVRLLKPKWSAVLENSFGTTLSSFIVTSKRDMNILSGIMQRINWYGLSPADSGNMSNEQPASVPYSSEAKAKLRPPNMNQTRVLIQP
jgi:chromosome segregation ATPase